MINPPNLSTQQILDATASQFGVRAARVSFLPLGADVNTAVYRVETGEGAAYFLKLRKGPFDETGVAVPQFLKSRGVKEMIAPLETTAGRLWGRLDAYHMILYPFIEGQDGYRAALTDEQWLAFGAAVRAMHRSRPTAEIRRLLSTETYTPRWRSLVRRFQEMAETETWLDPVAEKLAAFVREQRDAIRWVVERAEALGEELQSRPLEFVLCHADLHPGNLLITPGGALYLVDWDNVLLAPKERDLMVIGAGMGGNWDGERVEALFAEGYGPADVDPAALAYYRYERVVQDIAAFCEQLLLSDEGGEDREQAYRYFVGNFLPGREIDCARQADPQG